MGSFWTKCIDQILPPCKGAIILKFLLHGCANECSRINGKYGYYQIKINWCAPLLIKKCIIFHLNCSQVGFLNFILVGK